MGLLVGFTIRETLGRSLTAIAEQKGRGFSSRGERIQVILQLPEEARLLPEHSEFVELGIELYQYGRDFSRRIRLFHLTTPIQSWTGTLRGGYCRKMQGLALQAFVMQEEDWEIDSAKIRTQLACRRLDGQGVWKKPIQVLSRCFHNLPAGAGECWAGVYPKPNAKECLFFGAQARWL